tara:strand:+ start:631 stop:1689 length:1059 start_codon:yes stop_codon:yes gene_type:complete
MPLPASGNSISLDQIHVELGEDSGTTVALGDTDVRNLASDTSGAIGMDQFFGLSAVAWYGTRGVSLGGKSSGVDNTISFFTIQTTGNVADFGNLTSDRRTADSGVSDGTRILVGGGDAEDGEDHLKTIDKITAASTGNATDFGDLLLGNELCCGYSSGIRGFFVGGEDTSNVRNVNQFVVIASDGNATDFGDLVFANAGKGTTAAGNTTRGINAGAQLTDTSAMGYWTPTSAGNAVDFGDLTVGRREASAVASETRMVISGGFSGSTRIDVMDYVTIGTTGNATDFGDLSAGKANTASTGDATRGVIMGGKNAAGNAQFNVMEFVTIANTGNVTDFGDLHAAIMQLSASSGS